MVIYDMAFTPVISPTTMSVPIFNTIAAPIVNRSNTGSQYAVVVKSNMIMTMTPATSIEIIVSLFTA